MTARKTTARKKAKARHMLAEPNTDPYEKHRFG